MQSPQNVWRHVDDALSLKTGSFERTSSQIGQVSRISWSISRSAKSACILGGGARLLVAQQVAWGSHLVA